MKKTNKNVLNDCKLNKRELSYFNRIFGVEGINKDDHNWYMRIIYKPFFINDNSGDWADMYEFFKDELLPAYKNSGEKMTLKNISKLLNEYLTKRNDNSKKPNGRLHNKFYLAKLTLPAETEVKIIYVKSDREKLSYIYDNELAGIVISKIDGLPYNVLIYLNKSDVLNKKVAVNKIVKLKKSNSVASQVTCDVEYPIEILKTFRVKTILNLKQKSNELNKIWQADVASKLFKMYVRKMKNLTEKNKEKMPADVYNLLIQHIKNIDLPNDK